MADLRFDEDRMDAGESLFFARQLEYIRPQVFDIKRPPLNALVLFPIDRSVPAWAEKVTYTMWDATGVARIIASYADDLPMVGLTGLQYSSFIKTLGIGYGWSTAELRAAAATGINLSAKKAIMAKRGDEIAINRIAWFGDADANLPGFLTNVNIPAYNIPANGTGTSKLWVNKTADQIIADMNGIVNAVYVQSKGVHKANEVWIPLAQYAYIGSQPRSGTTDTTILGFFLANNPGVVVKPILELTGTEHPNLYSGQDVIVAADNSLENYQLILPMAFVEHPVQFVNLSAKVPCESRIGGVVIEYPFAFAIGSGI